MKQVVQSYTFNVANKTVTLTDFTTVRLERLLLIIDSSTNTVLYNFVDPSISSATVSGNTVTLSAGGLVTGHLLQIDYDVLAGDPIYDQLALPANAAKETGGNLAAIATSTSGGATSSNQTNGSQKTQVTNFPATQPVSALALPLAPNASLESGGNLAAIASSTAVGATSANQTNGTQRTQVTNFPVSQVVTASSLPLPGNAAQESGGNLASIASSTAGGATAANQTSGNQLIKLTNGTTVLDVIAGDSGQNAAIIAGSRSEQSFSVTAPANTTAKDISNLAWVSVQIVSQGTGSSVTFQGSNDGLTWTTIGLHTASVTATGGVLGNEYTFTTASGIFYGPLNARYFRLSITGISAGTTAGTIEYFASARALVLPTVTAVQNGTWTVTSIVANTTSASSAVTSIAASVVSTSLSALNVNRKGWFLFNDSTSVLYLAFAATAATTAYTAQVSANSMFEMPTPPVYTGAISGVWASAAGNARITELT